MNMYSLVYSKRIMFQRFHEPPFYFNFQCLIFLISLTIWKKKKNNTVVKIPIYENNEKFIFIFMVKKHSKELCILKYWTHFQHLYYAQLQWRFELEHHIRYYRGQHLKNNENIVFVRGQRKRWIYEISKKNLQLRVVIR